MILTIPAEKERDLFQLSTFIFKKKKKKLLNVLNKNTGQ